MRIQNPAPFAPTCGAKCFFHVMKPPGNTIFFRSKARKFRCKSQQGKLEQMEVFEETPDVAVKASKHDETCAPALSLAERLPNQVVKGYFLASCLEGTCSIEI